MDNATFHRWILPKAMLPICGLVNSWFCKWFFLVKMMQCQYIAQSCLGMKCWVWMSNGLIWPGIFTRALRANCVWTSKTFKWSCRTDSCWPECAKQTQRPRLQIWQMWVNMPSGGATPPPLMRNQVAKKAASHTLFVLVKRCQGNFGTWSINHGDFLERVWFTAHISYRYPSAAVVWRFRPFWSTWTSCPCENCRAVARRFLFCQVNQRGHSICPERSWSIKSPPFCRSTLVTGPFFGQRACLLGSFGQEDPPFFLQELHQIISNPLVELRSSYVVSMGKLWTKAQRPQLGLFHVISLLLGY